MKISFNDLVNSLSVNHKKENTKFLLSDKIMECSNTLTKDNFFVLEDKEKDTERNIYIDKCFFHKVNDELINVIKGYTEDDLYHLDKVFATNDIYKNNSPFICKDNGSFLFSNLDSLDNVRDFISRVIKKTKSSTLKKSIFNKDKCPTINIFFYNGLFTKFKAKSLSLLIKELSNKTIELNVGCDLPYQLDNKNNVLMVKFGNIKAANYNVEYENPDKKLKDNNFKYNELGEIKHIITEFEIYFNFLNENIKQYYEIADNSCLFANVKEINDVFYFIDINIIENIKESYYKCDDLQFFNDELVSSYNEINNNCEALDLYYKENIFNADDSVIIKLDIDNLKHKLKEIKSNTDLLKLKLESLKDFSSCVSQRNNEFKDKISHLKKSDKKIVCDSMIKTKEKTNECLSLLDGFIKRKETGFLSKVYKFFFPKKHNESLSLLINYKSEINKISSYLNSYKEKNEYFTINDISLMVTSKLSKINYPESLLGYLYGEKSKCNNYIQSLFKKDD